MWVDMVGKLKELLCFRIIDCSGRFLSRTSRTTCSMRDVCSHWVGGGGTFATAAAATGKAAAGEAVAFAPANGVVTIWLASVMLLRFSRRGMVVVW